MFAAAFKDVPTLAAASVSLLEICRSPEVLGKDLEWNHLDLGQCSGVQVDPSTLDPIPQAPKAHLAMEGGVGCDGTV